MKRIAFSDQAKADLRPIPQPIALNILTAIHRLAESGAGRVKVLRGQEGDKRLRVGDYRVRFTEDAAELLIHAVKNRKDATAEISPGSRATAEATPSTSLHTRFPLQ